MTDFVLITPEDYEDFKEYKHRKYVADALKAVEKKRDDANCWIAEEDFLAGLE